MNKKNLESLLSSLKKEIGYENATDLQTVAFIMDAILVQFIMSNENIQYNPSFYSCVEQGLRILSKMHSEGMMISFYTSSILGKNDYLNKD